MACCTCHRPGTLMAEPAHDALIDPDMSLSCHNHPSTCESSLTAMSCLSWNRQFNSSRNMSSPIP